MTWATSSERLGGSEVDGNSNDVRASTDTINVEPQNGCVVFGSKEHGRPSYVTRFCINHKKQRSDTFQLTDACCPFMDSKNTGSCCSATWSVLRSECFMFSCHIVVLLLGVLKEIFYMREWDEDLHMVHTALENALCLFVVFLRMGTVFHRYKEIKQFILDNEHITERSIRGRSIKIWMILYLVFGSFMMLAVGGSFAAFYILSHLGWTVLVTNFTLMLMYVGWCLFLDRINAVVMMIVTDQHKAVIHEAVLLLKEGMVAVSAEQKLTHFRRTDRFLSSVRNSEVFKLPAHIGIIEGFDFESITLKELESTV